MPRNIVQDFNSPAVQAWAPAAQAVAANYPNLTPTLLLSVITIESTGDATQGASGTGPTGLMQMEPGTFAENAPKGANILNGMDNLNAGAKYLSNLITQNGGDVYKALAIYDGAGTEVKNGTALPQETQNYLQYVSTLTNTPAEMIPGTPAAPSVPLLQPNDADATPAVALFGVSRDLTAASAASLVKATNPSIIITSGLDETPWYKDPNIARSKRPKPVAYPVTFKLYFDDKGPLSDSSNKPIVICLNCSLTNCSKSMQHIVSRQHTRTGVLIDLWGSNLDVISGDGSTGLFLNQVGMTSYFSLAKPTDQIKAAISSAFAKKTKFKDSFTQASKVSSVLGALPSAAPFLPTNGFFTESGLRVGARDAFVELLSLFKNNGVVYFRSLNDTGYTSEAQQVGPNAWSPKTGRSTFQATNSRGDVLTRGRVEMSFRNSQYSGYFKSLSWAMDASKPYTWDFNFVFQVESSITTVDVAPTSQQYKKQQSTAAVAAAKQAADQAVAQTAATTDPLASLPFNLPTAPAYAPTLQQIQNGSVPVTVSAASPPYLIPPTQPYNPLAGI